MRNCIFAISIFLTKSIIIMDFFGIVYYNQLSESDLLYWHLRLQRKAGEQNENFVKECYSSKYIGYFCNVSDKG